ncbi:MAG: hypothetical protein R3F62_12440 [Planctomycetota bacterium]
MSLFAFILVLGIVVDDAIVTGENIYTHLRAGRPDPRRDRGHARGRDPGGVRRAHDHGRVPSLDRAPGRPPRPGVRPDPAGRRIRSCSSR